MYYASQLGLPSADVVLYCPGLTAMKEAAVPVETSSGLTFLNDSGSMTSAEIRTLEDRYVDLWRFYLFVPSHAINRAALIGQHLLEVPQELIAR